jgi:CBS domain containing-hemolysin-like protein
MPKYLVKGSIRFALIVGAVTVPMSAIFDTSTVFLNRAQWYIGALVVLCIVIVGVVFDMIGLAAAAARETPFHSMASKRIFGAKRAIMIVRNAEKVSSICSDVVGDIAGVLSGAGALAVAVQLALSIHTHGWKTEAVSIFLTACITAITVFAKAIGKTVAIHSPTPIILAAAKIWQSIDVLLGRERKPRKRNA